MLRLPRRRDADPGRVREELPVRARRRRVGQGPGRPGLGRRPHGAGLRRRRVRRLLRRPADRRGRPPSARSRTCSSTTGSTAARPRPPSRPEWTGGERYGDENNHYYAEFRGEVEGHQGRRQGRGLVHRREGAGRDDDVDSARSPTPSRATRAPRCSCSPTRTTRASTRPTRPADGAEVRASSTSTRSAPPATAPTSGTSTRRACRTTSACSATTRRSSGTSATTASRRTPRTSFIDTAVRASCPTSSVAEREQYLTMAVRDFLNEGGKLIHTGETAQYYGLPGSRLVGGIYYGLNGDPSSDASSPRPGPVRRLPAAGRRLPPVLPRRVHARQPRRPDRRSTASRRRSTGYQAALAGTPSNPLDEAGVFQPTSDVLPVDRVPAVREPGRRDSTTSRAARSRRSRAPRTRRAVHAGQSYMRLTRTIDLTAVTAAEAPKLQFQLSYDTEAGLRPRDRRGAHRRSATTGRRCPTSTAARDRRCRPSASGLPARRCTRSSRTT